MRNKFRLQTIRRGERRDEDNVRIGFGSDKCENIEGK